jgi:GDP-D-mannose dehydratase
MYGKVQEVPQRESTPFYPRSPCALTMHCACALQLADAASLLRRQMRARS